jgi:hypothetical protein
VRGLAKLYKVRCIEQALLERAVAHDRFDPDQIIELAQNAEAQWDNETLGLTNFEVYDGETNQLLYKADDPVQPTQERALPAVDFLHALRAVVESYSEQGALWGGEEPQHLLTISGLLQVMVEQARRYGIDDGLVIKMLVAAYHRVDSNEG